MTRYGLTHGPRFRSGYHALRHGEASVRLGDPMARGSRFELPALHGDGRDHIVGGGGDHIRQGRRVRVMVTPHSIHPTDRCVGWVEQSDTITLDLQTV